MRSAALFLLLLCSSTIAHAQSITSFNADTTATHAHTPEDAVDIPVWLGVQIAPIPGWTSELQTQERTDAQKCTPWIGVGAAWPGRRRARRGSRRDTSTGSSRARSAWKRSCPAARCSCRSWTDLVGSFSARFGIDQWFWQPKRVSVVVGAGVGIGTGWTQAPTPVESNVLLDERVSSDARSCHSNSVRACGSARRDRFRRVRFPAAAS
jgi:hypothetical protein